MSPRKDDHRLRDIEAAITAIERHLKRGTIDDELIFDACRARRAPDRDRRSGQRYIDPELLARSPAVPWRVITRMRDHLSRQRNRYNSPMDNGRFAFEIRVARQDDQTAIAHLRALWTGVESDTLFRERLSEWLTVEGDRRTTWLAWVGQEPVGMASLFEYRRMPRPGRDDSRWGYLSNMFVRDEYRTRGIGSALLLAIIAWAEERAYARLVLSPSERAVRFYQRAGFVVPNDSDDGVRLLVRPTRPA